MDRSPVALTDRSPIARGRTAILIGGLLWSRLRGATALSSRHVRISMFVSAAWDVAPFGRLRWVVAARVSLTHVLLLEVGASRAGRPYATVMHSQLARTATSS